MYGLSTSDNKHCTYLTKRLFITLSKISFYTIYSHISAILSGYDHLCHLHYKYAIVTFRTKDRGMALNLIDNAPLSDVVVTCSLLPIPTNGQRSSSRRNYNDRVSFSCNTGYNLRGSSSRTCQSTGQWSGTHPTCHSKCRVHY